MEKKPAPVDRSCIQVFPVFFYISGGAGFFPSTVLLMEKNPVTVEPRSFGWSTPWRLFLLCDRIENVWETKKLRHRGRVITAFISVQTMSNIRTSFDIFCILDHLGILIPWPCNLNYCILEISECPWSPPASMGILGQLRLYISLLAAANWRRPSNKPPGASRASSFQIRNQLRLVMV